MAKEVFGEFAAFTSRGGVRFSKNGKMTSENAVPPEVVAYLKDKIAKQPVEEEATVPPVQKFPMPSEEEKARLRAESLQVPDELKLSPEEEAARALTGVPDNEEPLTPDAPLGADDFDAPDSAGDQPLPRADEPVALPEIDPSFLDSVSIHTAPLQAIAQALYDRFGVYTIWLNMLPQTDEVNPLTGETFTKYHQGIAYQSAIAANAKGLISPEAHRKAMDEGREASANFQQPFVEPPRTLAEARQQDSFAFRTSAQGTRPASATRIEHVTDENGQVHAVQVEVPISEHGGTARSRYDADEDEQVLEPPIFGTKPIIKPNW